MEIEEAREFLKERVAHALGQLLAQEIEITDIRSEVHDFSGRTVRYQVSVKYQGAVFTFVV